MADILAPSVDPCLMCLPQGQLMGILVYLYYAQANGQTVPTDIQSLLDNSACIESCMPPGAMLASLVGNAITVTNIIAAGGGTLTCGDTDPVTPPTDQTKCAQYYQKTSKVPWYWNNTLLVWE